MAAASQALCVLDCRESRAERWHWQCWRGEEPWPPAKLASAHERYGLQASARSHRAAMPG